jgi:hypothetical protein
VRLPRGQSETGMALGSAHVFCMIGKVGTESSSSRRSRVTPTDPYAIAPMIPACFGVAPTTLAVGCTWALLESLAHLKVFSASSERGERDRRFAIGVSRRCVIAAPFAPWRYPGAIPSELHLCDLRCPIALSHDVPPLRAITRPIPSLESRGNPRRESR